MSPALAAKSSSELKCDPGNISSGSSSERASVSIIFLACLKLSAATLAKRHHGLRSTKEGMRGIAFIQSVFVRIQVVRVDAVTSYSHHITKGVSIRAGFEIGLWLTLAASVGCYPSIAQRLDLLVSGCTQIESYPGSLRCC